MDQQNVQAIGEQIIKIIRMILITERDVEELKITLAENIRFDISDAFRSIDSNMKGYILPQDIFRFMSKNGFSVTIKMCDFWIYTTSKGEQKLTYQHFLEFIIPRYDRESAMACVTRKLYSEAGQFKLTFYLEEFVSKLIFKELEFTKSIEVEKMRLAQMVEWKFNVVFKLVAGNAQTLDKKALDNLLIQFDIQPLTQKDYLMFLKRFNRNDDNLIQKDEFNDAIFPSGYLMQQKDQTKDGFYDYVVNQNQQLDQYLGRDQQNQEEEYVFKPEDHKINTSAHEDLVKDSEKRYYLNEDPQLTVSHFEPNYTREHMSFKPTYDPIPITVAQTQPLPQPRSKNYVSQTQNQQQDLLQEFERRQRENMQNSNQYNVQVYNSNIQQIQQSGLFQNNYSQKEEFDQYVHQPTNAQLLLQQK